MPCNCQFLLLLCNWNLKLLRSTWLPNHRDVVYFLVTKITRRKNTACQCRSLVDIYFYSRMNLLCFCGQKSEGSNLWICLHIVQHKLQFQDRAANSHLRGLISSVCIFSAIILPLHSFSGAWKDSMTVRASVYDLVQPHPTGDTHRAQGAPFGYQAHFC